MSVKILIAVFIALAAPMLAGCRGGPFPRAYAASTGGSADRGRDVLRKYDCGSCHTIPGIREAQGVVGPPLFFFSRRTFIAGELPNSSENLIRWIRSPQSVEPGTAMPQLGLSESEARDAAAYLFTLY